MSSHFKSLKFVGCTLQNTYHVDGFLYPSDVVDEMSDSGQLPTYYCSKCGSQSIEKLSKLLLLFSFQSALISIIFFKAYISHSATVNQLKFIFSTLTKLNGNTLKGKTVLDVIEAAHFFLLASNI